MIPSFDVEEYKTIKETSVDALNVKVNRLLQDGWLLWGTLSSSSTQYTQHYAQTLLKPKSHNKFVDENHPPDERFPPEFFRM